MRILKTRNPMNYADVDRALKSLGFTRSEVKQENAIIYRHADNGASIILPIGADTEAVHPLDLITVKKTVVEKGVATLEQYTASVRKARLRSFAPVSMNGVRRAEGVKQ